MIRPRAPLPLFVAALLLSASVQGNEQYNLGSEFARGIKGQEQAAIGGFDPAGTLPDFTSTPPEAGYYGGVTTPSTNLTSQGNAALHQSRAGQAITESILNTPSGNKPSMDAPFISAGTDAQSRAESMTDGSFDGCVKQQVTNTEFTNHVCSKDTRVDQYCARTATIEGNWVNTSYDHPVTIAHGAISYGVSGDNVTFSFTAPISGVIRQASLRFNRSRNLVHYPTSVSLLNASFGELKTTGTYALPGAAGMTLHAGLTYSGSMRSNLSSGSASSYLRRYFAEGHYTYAIDITIIANGREFNPYLVWRETCPFNKAEGALTNTECTEPGGNRTVHVEGRPYSLYSSCWAYKDTYLTQTQSEGSCREYINNPACTIANRQCAYSLDGFCLHENLTYSCQHNTTGAGVMCGGTFFCKDGSCAQSMAGKNKAFQKAVSQLAAVAAAGEDVAELNGADVRAFTGQARFCKKFAAGFSNCCKDSGWGQDVGLSSCSSEEQALGEARQRKLTVDVGEFCSKKVLGVCVEKKRSYCVFDSKLAQIVQQQGRQWQLGIGFGGASSPDCRGITIDELQAIKFDNLDFSNFYDELQNGSTIPQDNALLERVQQQVAEHVYNQQFDGQVN